MGTASVRVDLPNLEGRGYEVLIRRGILEELADGTMHLPDASSHAIITDSNVHRLYGKKLLDALSRLKPRVELLRFPAGERNKTMETASSLASRLSKLRVDRGGMLLALGGGVVGDVVGFVASIYKRGIDYIQLPTTLLAQVDSSIGGKTGVDTLWGKNQLGTFFQPKAVLTDPTVLSTLPHGELLNGLAEVVKYAVIADKEMFAKIDGLSRFDSQTLGDYIVPSCKIKAAIVSRDERENNLRVVLNFGHTVGHAIESASDYGMGHGSCVVFGMAAESWIALQLGILRKGDFEKLIHLFKTLATRFGIDLPPLDKGKLFGFALADKKNVSSSIRMSLPERIGWMHGADDGSYLVPVPKRVFYQSIDSLHKSFDHE